MALPPAPPPPGTFQPRRLSYAAYDEPCYSRLLVLVRGTPHISAVRPHFAAFGDVEEIWGELTDLDERLQGPVFVKFARSSQAFRALEAFRGAPPQAFPLFSQMYLAQSRVPGKSNELEMDLQKLTVIRVTIPRFITENVLANTFKVYGVIVSCFFVRIEFGKSKDLGYIGFSKPSEAALAIEECDKRFQAVWAEAKPDFPKHPVLRFGVYGAQQGTTKREVQEATLNTICKNTSLANSVTEPSKVSESKTVNNPKQKTACKEVQESSVNTLGKSSSLAKVAIEPSKLSASKSDVSNSKPKITSSEVQKICVNTSGRHTKWDVRPTTPSVICTEKKIRSEMEWSNSIPVVSRNTLSVPMNRTESRRGGAEKISITHNILRKNLVVLGPEPEASANCSSGSNIEKKGSRTCRSNLITLGSFENATSSVPAAGAPKSGVNYWVNHTEEKINCTSSEESNLIALAYRSSEVQQVFKPAEHSGYEYYVDGTDYSAALSEPSMQPPGSNLDYYYNTSGVEEQTDDHSIKESNMMTSGYSMHLPLSVTQPFEPNVFPIYESTTEPEAKGAEVQQDTVRTTEKFLKSSEWKFYMGGARRKKRSQGNSLLTSVDPPNLASVERSNSRKQDSISRQLLIISEFPLTQEQIFGLFDVIPGLESCEVRPGLHSKRVYAMIKYRNVASAVYAKHRVHGLEYPLGNQLHISFIEDKTHGTELLQEMATQLVTSYLASVIWDNNWAPQLLRSTESWIPPPRLQTDALLPSYKRKAPPDSSIRERLLVIFDPCPLPQNVLDNVLSRFGNFIASHLIPGKNGAYALFAERASAGDAIAVLHGKTVNDVKMKVTLSDLPMEDFSKRQRLF